MAVVNTTNIIDNSIFLKAKLAPNMVGDNYYIENLQDKRNQDWEYRYNRVEIEEEPEKRIQYVKPDILGDTAVYNPIDVVITNVKNEKGDDLGTDWASLSFRDLKHPTAIGKRYRFSLDFPDMTKMTDEQKRYDTSVWLCVNKAPVHAGNSCTVRRCNTTVTLLGYENGDRKKTETREVHLEPAVLDSDLLKYMQVYYNEVLPSPQSEWYLIMQLNYYTNCIKINDRFIFGTIDTEVRENNAVYKVKSVIKSNTTNTYVRNREEELATTPVVIIALDKDTIGENDDFKNRIANGAPVYSIGDIHEEEQQETPSGHVYTLKNSETLQNTLAYRKSQEYDFQVLCDDERIIFSGDGSEFEMKYTLKNKAKTQWNNYFKIEYTSKGIKVTNLQGWSGGPLEITLTYPIPQDAGNSEEQQLIKKYVITLNS